MDIANSNLKYKRMEYYIDGRWIKSKNINGTYENASDNKVLAYLDQQSECVFTNGIVVHASVTLMEKIIKWNSKVGIKPAQKR